MKWTLLEITTANVISVILTKYTYTDARAYILHIIDGG